MRGLTSRLVIAGRARACRRRGLGPAMTNGGSSFAELRVAPLDPLLDRQGVGEAAHRRGCSALGDLLERLGSGRLGLGLGGGALFGNELVVEVGLVQELYVRDV